ncbi:MAG: DeoR family transcriptional regulator [bacterium]|nr:DeoR family transcriptional regulator [bacterium]
MAELPSMRQERIMAWLAESHTLTIEQLAEHFGVSIMTIHRDLDHLVRSGQVEKVHGGVRLSVQQAAAGHGTCGLCGGNIHDRTQFLVQPGSEAVRSACCAHCGLLMLDGVPETAVVLVRDFLYGRIVNGRQAAYLVESSVTLCCSPGVLSFACAGDAERFQQGFGGRVMTLAEVYAFLNQLHRAM